MYKLAEFRKSLEQKKHTIVINPKHISSWGRVYGSTARVRHYDESEKCNQLMSMAKDQRRDVETRLRFAKKAYAIKNKSEDEVKPIRDMMKRVNEMYNKPR